MEYNILDPYLLPSASPLSSIEELIIEKNRLIEEYKAYIEQLIIQSKEESMKHSSVISHYKSKLESLQKKCEAIDQGEIKDLVQYYECEISKMLQHSKKQAEVLKTQITFITSSFPDQTKLKKVISTLMVENSSLKDLNETLFKITRMNEAYKLMARQYESRIEAKDKVFSSYEREQNLAVSSLSNDNKRLKDQIAEDKKTIKNLLNTIELMKSNGSRSRKCFSSNVTASNQSTKRFFTEYEENKTEIELSNVRLDKFLNGSKMLIGEKTEIAKKAIEKILNRIMNENSAYKAIIKKEIMLVRSCVEVVLEESMNLIKKANSSYNAYELSRNLLRELIVEHEYKSRHSKGNNLKKNTPKDECLSDERIDTIGNSIELAKRYLNTFE